MPCELWVKPMSEVVSFFAKCLHLGDFFFKTAKKRKIGKNVLRFFNNVFLDNFLKRKVSRCRAFGYYLGHHIHMNPKQ